MLPQSTSQRAPQPVATRSLIVAGSAQLTSAVAHALPRADVEVTCVTSLPALRDAVAQGAFTLAIVDSALAANDVAELARELNSVASELLIIAVFPVAQLGRGVDAVRAGLHDFLREPIDADEVSYVVNKALARPAPAEDEAPPSAFGGTPQLLGQSLVMRQLREELRRVARGNATILIRGETGTGKELVARSIHEASERKRGPFVKVHCGALPDTLLESELFGYERGAFTGAAQRKPGRVELAEGGTLFLDEIGDITPLFQLKLLRLLQDREYEALGGVETRRANVRFVAATHQDLESMVEKGSFRQDLFYRLNVVPLETPALRDRMEDFEALAIHFCSALAAQNVRPAVALDVAALDRLKERHWPGNIRELLHFIERLVVLTEGPRISLEQVERELTRRPTAMGLAAAYIPSPPLSKVSSVKELADALQLAEKRALEKALSHVKGNRDAAARLLAISRRTLFYKLREHDLS